MALVVSTLALLVFTILSIIKSQDKKKYLIYLVAVIVILALTVIVCWDTVLVLIREMSYKSLLGGREELLSEVFTQYGADVNTPAFSVFATPTAPLENK